MRKILFRGKILGGEKWVEGWLKPFTNGGYDGKDDRLCIQNGSHSFDIYEVDPKTVGQYTGLTDRNGKRIFEGDIIKDFWINGMPFLFMVEYSDKYCAFVLKNKNEYLDNGDGVLGVGELSREKEVIGNIYDNPELLKGAEEDD